MSQRCEGCGTKLPDRRLDQGLRMECPVCKRPVQKVAELGLKGQGSQPFALTTWPVRFADFFGRFRVQGQPAPDLGQGGALLLNPQGVLGLDVVYHPPGSGWLALLAAAGTAVVLIIMVSTFGVGIGPGWVVWYVIIRSLRRRPVRFVLQESEAIVLQPEDSLIGFRANVNGQPRWIAFSAGPGYEQIAKTIQLLASEKIVAGRIDRDAWVQISILLVLIAIVLATIGSFVATSMLR